MKLTIAIASRQKFLPPDRIRLRKTLSAILRARGRGGELSVALVGDAEIRRVHRDFLGDDTPTDVITFRFDGGDRSGGERMREGPFGELVISAETAVREAEKRGLDPAEELLRYAIHGALHLLGYDDLTPGGRRRMRRLERRYLKVFVNSNGSIRRRGGPRRGKKQRLGRE